MRHPSPLVLAFSLALGLHAAPRAPYGPDPQVEAAPTKPAMLPVKAPATIRAFAVRRNAPEVAVVVQSGEGSRIVLWKPGADPAGSPTWNAPAGLVPGAVAWHPVSHRLFVGAERAGLHELLVLEPAKGSFQATTLATAPGRIDPLLVGPCPFVTGKLDPGPEERIEYRLFFGSEDAQGTRSIRSVTESGTRQYQVIGPQATMTPAEEGHEDPSRLEAAAARPLAFHPNGQILLWTDGKTLSGAQYRYDRWGGQLAGELAGADLAFPANGAGFLRFTKGKPGVVLEVGQGIIPPSAGSGARDDGPRMPRLDLAKGTRFLAQPQPTPDGRGLVGPTAEGLAYVPVDMPLADVANAWQFASTPEELASFERRGGLLRRTRSDHVYRLLEWGGYVPGEGRKAVMVTTDLFWETFAAAFEGTMILEERGQTIPAFWAMVGRIREWSATLGHESRWTDLAEVLEAVRKGDTQDAEAARVLAANGVETSTITKDTFDYRELMPRGHYAADPELATYFKAFRYFTTLGLPAQERDDLARAPAGVREPAMRWIRPYLPFIASPRAPLLWDASLPLAPWCRHPLGDASLFPMGWGIDQEIMDVGTFHATWPEKERIVGPGGPRLLPSGLDVAAALGSTTARTLLADAVKRYPPLGPALAAVTRRAAAAKGGTLYDQWLAALAVQWADLGELPAGFAGRELYRIKRLQTGLASWASLRHATLLVNDRGSAECGEGGLEPFEEIVIPSPRGYVEPDPASFDAIASLFEATAGLIRGDPRAAADRADPTGAKAAADLRQGLGRRLQDCAKEARDFADIARRELQGTFPSDLVQPMIGGVAGRAEYAFEVFQSMSRADLSIGNPDPMMEIADVYGSAATKYLLVALGQGMEWDAIVPFQGRREIVQGSTLSYFELQSPELLDDEHWRERCGKEASPSWIEPHLVGAGRRGP